jgi:hypothetical protein
MRSDHKLLAKYELGNNSIIYIFEFRGVSVILRFLEKVGHQALLLNGMAMRLNGADE